MNTGKFTGEKLTFALLEGAGAWDVRGLAAGVPHPDYLEGADGIVGPGGWADVERSETWGALGGGARAVQLVQFGRRAPANLVAARAAWNARPASASKTDVAVVREALDDAALPNPSLVPVWQVDELVGIGCTGKRAAEVAAMIADRSGFGSLAKWGCYEWLSKIVAAGLAGRRVAGAPVYPTGRRLALLNADGDVETISVGGATRAVRVMERLRAGERVVRAVLSMAIDGPGGAWAVSWTAADGSAAEAAGWKARPPVGMAGVDGGPGARLAVWRAWADAWRSALAALAEAELAELLAEVGGDREPGDGGKDGE